VANPRLMEGSKRRKRKNDRIDANKLARLGRVDPESLHRCTRSRTAVGKCGRTWWWYEPAMRWWRRERS
jgi:transposase